MKKRFAEGTLLVGLLFAVFGAGVGLLADWMYTQWKYRQELEWIEERKRYYDQELELQRVQNFLELVAPSTLPSERYDPLIPQER